MTPPLVILTGASGSGKTTLATAIKDRYRSRFEVLFFDSIGVPSAEEMSKWGSGYQPGGAWQRAMTLQWIERLAEILALGRSVLFEGQMRLAFIREGLEVCRIARSHTFLVDCDDATRADRLILNRGQPQFAGEPMMAWAGYLRREFSEVGYGTVLDTGKLSLDDCVQRIHSCLEPSPH